MPKIRLLISLITLTCIASLTSAQDSNKSYNRGRHNLNISTNDSGPSDSCADRLNIYSDDYADTVRSEESRNFPNQPLKVTASRNGGIQVHTWDKAEISVKICKAAAARNATEARATLDQIKLNANGNELSVTGPDRGGNHGDEFTWSTVILINAPAGATFDLSAHNGGIALKQFNGNATVDTVNGGIALDRSSGKLNVQARNGGISIKDCGGSVKADVQNGGLHIELAETWNGEGLQASTHNGGLSIAVPKNMQSGVELSLSRHSGVVCQADVCSSGNRSWDDDGSRTIRFGTGNTVIRASTVNGGTVIKERGSRARL
ncbi:MAG TPA: hypothetical protein VMZ25_00130 [Terriglobales bacterium]|nr:hypothetical protein [Terriglobales bacterium]